MILVVNWLTKTLFKINVFAGFEYYLVNINLKTLITCSSTNDLAFQGAQDGLEEGVSFLSYSQTKGRGRNDNKWTSLKAFGKKYQVLEKL